MLLKILGGIDVVLGLVLILFGTAIVFPKIILIVCGAILLIKCGLRLLKDFASWIDLIGGLIFLLLIFVEIPGIIVIIIGLFVAQKGILSFL